MTHFFRAVDFRAVDLDALLVRLPPDGTLPPFSRASLRPMAIACLRLVTLRPDPLFSVPRLRRRIADFTVFEAPLPYFAIA
jgi:hypothetical protein